MNMTMSYNPYSIFATEGPQIISNGFGGPRFSWKMRLFAIAVIVVITTIGGAFRITIGANSKQPTYTDTQLQRKSGVVLQEVNQASPILAEWEQNTVTVRLNNLKTPERVLVNVEVFDERNQRVAQRYWDNVLIPKGKLGVCGANCPAFNFVIPGLMAGRYTVDVGIFKPGWKAGPIRWYDGVQTFSVTSGQLGAYSTSRQ